MKTIGLVVGHHCDTALEIKAAILAKDASVTVLLDEGDFVEPAADATDALKEATRKINNFNAAKRLPKAGADVIGFACGCPHRFFAELQTEFTVRLVDPACDSGERLSAADYAQALLTADVTPLPKPFKVGMIGGLGPAATRSSRRRPPRLIRNTLSSWSNRILRFRIARSACSKAVTTRRFPCTTVPSALKKTIVTASLCRATLRTLLWL